MKKRWKYVSDHVAGNFHYLVKFLNEHHPDWELIAAEMSGYNTIFICRVEVK